MLTTMARPIAPVQGSTRAAWVPRRISSMTFCSMAPLEKKFSIRQTTWQFISTTDDAKSISRQPENARRSQPQARPEAQQIRVGGRPGTLRVRATAGIEIFKTAKALRVEVIPRHELHRPRGDGKGFATAEVESIGEYS